MIDISLGQNKGWTIASGTKTYKGLHGKGIEEGGVTGTKLDITLKGRVFRGPGVASQGPIGGCLSL